jgi:twitching motility two-component system response regulator PilG
MSGVTAALRDGILAAQAREFDRARELLQQVTSESANDPVGWFWLAIASPSASEAIPCLRRVLELDGAHDQARTALTKLLQSEAHRLAASGARSDARAFAAEASRLTPDSQAVWLALAGLTDDQKERLEALRQAVKIAPDDLTLRTRLRQALLARGVMPSTDRVEARACFREASQLNADDPRVWQALAKLAETPAESVEALRHLLRIAPNTPNAPVALRSALAADARELVEAKRLEEAYKRWREAADLAGGDCESWLGVAGTTTIQEEKERAIETAYKLNPSNEQAIAAMRKLQASKIDPSKVAAPVDAFARFGATEESAEGELAGLEGDATLDGLDATLDAFASLPDAPAEFEPVPEADADVNPVQAIETAPESVGPETDLLSELDVEAPASAAPAEPEPPVASTPSPVAEMAAMPESLPEPAPVAAMPVPAMPVAAMPVAAMPVAVTPADATPALSSNGSSRKTVMIVDDSPTIRKILGLTLERAGYKVVAEPDGESAIERLIQTVPDLILLDIAMPKIDGYEVCKRIKGDPRTKHVPVVMLSGKGALFDKVKGHMAGATEYLTKPFETPAVLAVVTNYCELPAAEVVNG